MSLSEDQLFAISVAERVSSTLSLICASTAVLTFISKKAFHTAINRLIVYALYGNIAVNIATLIARAGPQHPQSSLCSFQAFLVQWFVSEHMNNISISNIKLIVSVHQGSSRRMHYGLSA